MHSCVLQQCSLQPRSNPDHHRTSAHCGWECCRVMHISILDIALPREGVFRLVGQPLPHCSLANPLVNLGTGCVGCAVHHHSTCALGSSASRLQNENKWWLTVHSTEDMQAALHLCPINVRPWIYDGPMGGKVETVVRVLGTGQYIYLVQWWWNGILFVWPIPSSIHILITVCGLKTFWSPQFFKYFSQNRAMGMNSSLLQSNWLCCMLLKCYGTVGLIIPLFGPW